jgi:hypothetical protein
MHYLEVQAPEAGNMQQQSAVHSTGNGNQARLESFHAGA